MSTTPQNGRKNSQMLNTAASQQNNVLTNPHVGPSNNGNFEKKITNDNKSASKVKLPAATVNTKTPQTLVKIEESNDVVVPSLTAAALVEKNKDDNQQRLLDTRNKVLKHYTSIVDDLRLNFQEKLTQLFFVQSGGNMVDYPAWKGRPSPHLLSYLNSQRLDNTKPLFPSVPTAVKQENPPRKSTDKSSKKDLADAIALEQYGFVQGSHINPKEKSSKHHQSDSKSSLHVDGDGNKSQNGQKSSTSSLNSSIVGQVRHESETLHRIAELRKSGLWSASRLPKVFEAPRKKSHWDFLLEEMQWLATDFSQEKRWKRNMAKKVLLTSLLRITIFFTIH